MHSTEPPETTELPETELPETSEHGSLQDRFAKYFGHSPERIVVDFGARSDVGAVRTINEDHFIVVRRSRKRDVLMSNMPAELPPVHEENAYSIVVADGMGGTTFGQLASVLALQTAWELGGKEISWPMKSSKEEVRQLMEKLELYPLLMKEALTQRAREEPQLTGMGTTLTAAYTLGSNAFIAHVGDSRAYLMRGEALHMLTTDHTVAQQLIDAGIYAPDAEEIQHLHHMLTNCLDTNDVKIHVETRQIPLRDGDRLLLCSDGLTNAVDEDAIAEVLMTETSSQTACDRLVEIALKNNARDNVTVVIAGYEIPTTR
jgi:serine/threonine protein phosphatase PrpC